MSQKTLLSTDDVRDRFSKAMSAMYQAEVPQYGTLLELVECVNQETLNQHPELYRRLESQGELARLGVERHGAIRVGTAGELSMLRRLFAVMEMYPVGYYDLSEAGVPVHSTAFRPINDDALSKNPFRIFTSLLRLELIANEELRQRIEAILATRDIFTSKVRELIERHESQGGLSNEETDQFVKEALETFRWHQDATVDLDTYHALCDEHRLIADVVCFRGPHINHLTPRTSKPALRRWRSRFALPVMRRVPTPLALVKLSSEGWRLRQKGAHCMTSSSMTAASKRQDSITMRTKRL
jgi:uncharacterized glyoxalase superfamily metalloenzyme YdcJ